MTSRSRIYDIDFIEKTIRNLQTLEDTPHFKGQFTTTINKLIKTVNRVDDFFIDIDSPEFAQPDEQTVLEHILEQKSLEKLRLDLLEE